MSGPNALTLEQAREPALVARWDASRARGHSVQFYDSDAFLVDELSRVIGSALGAGDSAIVIATEAHRDALLACLRARGVDTGFAIRQGRFVLLDAAETLARFMIGGEPDATLFMNSIGPLVERLSRASGEANRVVAFGEMVALLWADRNPLAALALERLWNALAKTHAFYLHCAYPMELFVDGSGTPCIADVCSEHSLVIPTEQYTSIQNEEDRLRAILVLEQRSRSLESEMRRRERLQKELQDREAELRDYIENALIGMHWVSADGDILWANRAELQLLGYAEEEYVGRKIWEFHADSSAIDDILCRLGRFEPLHGHEARLRCKDGSTRDVCIHSNVYMRDGQFVHTRCFTIDVTEQKKAEQAQGRLAAIVESSEDAIVSKDLNGIVTSWNRSAERILGYRAEEIVGKPITVIIPPELLSEETEILGRIRRGENVEHFETIRINKSGEPRNVSLTISPIRGSDGNITGAAKILRDVTEEKKLIAALHTSERLASMGRLAATIAHEINNPLEAVGNLIYLSRETPEAPPKVREYLEAAEQELARAAHIAQQTLGFQRAASRPAQLVVADAVEAILGIYERKFALKGIDIRTRIQPGLTIFAFDGELKQVLSNLVSNALDACSEGGTLVVRAHRTAWREGAAPMARMTIADNGGGIAPENKARIFDPFFTTKEFVGTGLGLWITKSLIEKRGGAIQVRSRQTAPSGTVLSFCLPLQAESSGVAGSGIVTAA